MEAVRLRIQDVDFGMKQIIVRSGKGDKDRITNFAMSLVPLLQNHLSKVKTLHQQDLGRGHGNVRCGWNSGEGAGPVGPHREVEAVDSGQRQAYHFAP